MLSAALDAVGLNRAVVGLGDADLYRQLLTELGVGGEPRERILDQLAAHDLVGLETEVDEVEDLGPAGRETLLRLPGLRGERRDPRARPASSAATRSSARRSRLRRPTRRSQSAGVAERVQLDLGLLRDLGYYTGAILEVYDPALGHILGGGGRYDDLLGRFGRAMPAAGFSLYLERVHLAQAEEERIAAGGRRRRMRPSDRSRARSARASAGR